MTSRYLVGDVFDGLRTLEDDSVDLIISSPPFLALRSYLPADHELKGKEIGSEATPAAFLDVLLDVVEECARVLAPHGSLCFELGDTYSGSGGAGGDYAENGLRDGQPTFKANPGRTERYQAEGFTRVGGGNSLSVRPRSNQAATKGPGWPDPKSLCMIPQSFAWALSYGRNPFNGRETPRWKVRNIVRWCRPNPPVGALGDKYRPATSEMVVATKSGRRWFDLDAVRGAHSPNTVWNKYDMRDYATSNHRGHERDETGKGKHGMPMNPAGAPPLDWWEIPTQPYAGSHYATWPEKLLVRPILSMCPERVCTVCGEPSRRITETTQQDTGRMTNGSKPRDRAESFAGTTYETRTVASVETLGWTDCGHDDWRRGIVLDCFGGSGTTAAVAEGHGRDSILIDLDERNAELAAGRCGMFLTVEHGPVTDLPIADTLSP